MSNSTGHFVIKFFQVSNYPAFGFLKSIEISSSMEMEFVHNHVFPSIENCDEEKSV